MAISISKARRSVDKTLNRWSRSVAKDLRGFAKWLVKDWFAGFLLGMATALALLVTHNSLQISSENKDLYELRHVCERVGSDGLTEAFDCGNGLIKLYNDIGDGTFDDFVEAMDSGNQR